MVTGRFAPPVPAILTGIIMAITMAALIAVLTHPQPHQPARQQAA